MGGFLSFFFLLEKSLDKFFFRNAPPSLMCGRSAKFNLTRLRTAGFAIELPNITYGNNV